MVLTAACDYKRLLKLYHSEWTSCENDASHLISRLNDQLIQYNAALVADWTNIEAVFPGVKEKLVLKVTSLISLELSQLNTICSALKESLAKLTECFSRAESELNSLLKETVSDELTHLSLHTLADVTHSQYQYWLVVRETALKMFTLDDSLKDKQLLETISDSFLPNKQCFQTVNEFLAVLEVIMKDKHS